MMHSLSCARLRGFRQPPHLVNPSWPPFIKGGNRGETLANKVPCFYTRIVLGVVGRDHPAGRAGRQAERLIDRVAIDAQGQCTPESGAVHPFGNLWVRLIAEEDSVAAL